MSPKAPVDHGTLPSDADWIAALDRKDDAAVLSLRRLLVGGLRKSLPNFAQGRRDADLDDVASEAITRVLTALPGFRGDSAFTTWAMAIALRVAWGQLRRERFRERSLDSYEHAALTDESQPAGRMEAREATEVLHRSIRDALTPRQRTAVLAELDGVPTDIIAERLGINRNALYKLHHDARKKLRAALLERGFGPERLERMVETSP